MQLCYSISGVRSAVYRSHTTGLSYVDTPKLFHSVKSNDLFQEIVPVIPFGGRGLSELSNGSVLPFLLRSATYPETPSIHEWVLNVEVIYIMKDSLDFV
jgi:hypothetical protein